MSSTDPSTARVRAVAAAAVIAVLALVAIVAALAGHNRTPAVATAPLEGVTWTDTSSPGRIIFRGDRINVFDSCTGGWHVLTSTDHRFVIGRAVGVQQTCSPPADWPPPGVEQFDRVISGRLTWTRTGDDLRVTDARDASIEFVAGQPEPPAGCLNRCASDTPG